jgi:hypothetical protein
MGLNMLGDKKVRFLRELTGLNIDRASTNSAVESGRWWEFRVIEDDGHWHGFYDRRNDRLMTDDDGSLYQDGGYLSGVDEDPSFTHWSTCGDLT